MAATFLWSYFVDDIPRSGLAEYNGKKCWFEHTSTRQMTEEEIEKNQQKEDSEDEHDVDQLMKLMEDDEDEELYNVTGDQSTNNDFSRLLEPQKSSTSSSSDSFNIDKNILRNLLSNMNKTKVNTEVNVYTFYELKESDIKLLEEEQDRYRKEIGFHKDHDPNLYKRVDTGDKYVKTFTYTLNPNLMKGTVLTMLSEKDIKQFNIPTVIN